MENTKLLVEQSAMRLVDYILENNLEAGARLPNEYELANLLSVGRSTVREAVRILVSRNVLEVRQGAGTFLVQERVGVSEDPLGFAFIRDKDKLVLDLLEVRIAIEPRIAASAAVSATEEEITEMRELCGQVEELIHADADHMEPDVAFHTKIAQSSRNLVVPNLMPIIQSAISLFVDITNRQLKDETILTHREIVDAIEARDPIAAADAMTVHIIHNRNALRKVLRAKNPEE